MHGPQVGNAALRKVSIPVVAAKPVRITGISSTVSRFSPPERQPIRRKLRIARPARHICWHSQCGGAARAAAGAHDHEEDDDKPYNKRNPAHRVLLPLFRVTGLLRLWELLDDRLWVAGVVFVLGCAAGAAQGLAGD